MAETYPFLPPKSEKKIFVGYSESSKAYRLLDTDHKGNLTIAKTVVFFENKFPSLLFWDVWISFTAKNP